MKKLYSMLSTLPDPVLVIDREMRIVYQNPAVANLIGDHWGVKCHNAIDGRELSCEDCPATDSFIDGEYHQAVRMAAGPDGRARCVEISACPIKDENGRVTECVMFRRDLTALKEKESQRKDLLSMISHDLKAPMTVIYNYADIIMDKMPEEAEDERVMLSRIKSSAMKSAQLVEDFLTLSMIESGRLSADLKPGPLGTLAAVHAEEFKAMARDRDITILTDIPRDLPDALIDEKQCGRVISNILANAIKYSNDSGRVWVRAGVVMDDPRKVFIEISDEGPGIPERELPRITEKYYRAGGHGKASGTGLGLAIVKALTELHGGAVEIKSREGEGVTVRVVLRAAHPRSA